MILPLSPIGGFFQKLAAYGEACNLQISEVLARRSDTKKPAWGSRPVFFGYLVRIQH